MRFGIHLPQYGRVAGAEAITAAARRAEEVGFADVWVSDHVIHPAEQTYPSPYLFDPMLTLAWAAAATSRVGLGTSVLVAVPVAVAVVNWRRGVRADKAYRKSLLEGDEAPHPH